MSKELNELKKLDKKIENELNYIKSSPNAVIDDINTVKALKNNIHQKVSKIFVHNLKKLIQFESTQKILSKKIGVSQDLLSKYKSGEAFPSIETLIYLCEVYNISLNKFINTPLTTMDILNIVNNDELDSSIFEEKYYVYFYVTNIAKEGAIHEGIVEINNNTVTFKILSNENIVKYFNGSYNVSDKLIYFDLKSSNDGNAYINMIKPNVNKNKYVGGLAMLLLPSDANSKPCCQKTIFSKIRLDRELYFDNLKELLNFQQEETTFGNIKISQVEDELTYHFIQQLL